MRRASWLLALGTACAKAQDVPAPSLPSARVIGTMDGQNLVRFHDNARGVDCYMLTRYNLTSDHLTCVVNP